MILTRNEVEKVALLARLRLTDAELDTMTAQLGHVLGYIRHLESLDTTDVEPLAHSIDLHNVMAGDQTSAGLPCQDALAAAPKRDDECFLVPAVLGE